LYDIFHPSLLECKKQNKYNTQPSIAATLFVIINAHTDTNNIFIYLNDQNVEQNTRQNTLKSRHYPEQVLFTALCALLQAKHAQWLIKGGEWGS